MIPAERETDVKLLSIAVPCYNSAAFMEKNIRPLTSGGEEVEIILVDDGSTDETGRIADRLSEEYPSVIRVIHKENGGHGSAVNAGIDAAQGVYFKVVDSDDHLDPEAYRQVLETLRALIRKESGPDLMICNYVYDKEDEQQKKVIHYREIMPAGRLITWKETGKFSISRYILMHAAIYRTALLKECGMRLPEHCFYVDNIYVFEPLPFVKTIYYLDTDLYYYYIGREGQSVNQDVMISRLDQQMRVNRLMADFCADPAIAGRIEKEPALKEYMLHYLDIITAVSSVLAVCSGTPEHLKMRRELWSYIRGEDEMLYRKLRYGLLGIIVNLPGRAGRLVTVLAYRICRCIFKFN